MPAPTRSLVVLFLTVFIDLMGFGIVIPRLPLYASRLHATPGQVGALLAVYSLMQLVFAPAWGRLSDRVGRRPVLLVSLTGSAMSYFLLAAAGSTATLFAARVLAGIAGANISVAQAYIADVTAPEERARGMGLIGAAFGLGMVLGPALGAGFSFLGAHAPELFAAALCLANVGLAALRLPESLPAGARRPRSFRHPLSPGSLRESVGRPGAPALLGVFFLVTFCFAVLEGTFSLTASHVLGYSEAQVYGLFFYMGVVAVLVQGWLVGRLARRVPERGLILAGAVALMTGLSWIPFARHVGPMLSALALVVAGQGLAGPALSSLISKTVEASLHGEALGVSQSLSAAARVLGPAGGGVSLERLGAGVTYLLAAACAAGSIALVGARSKVGVVAVAEPSRLRRNA